MRKYQYVVAGMLPMMVHGQKLHTKGSSDVVSSPSWEFYDLQKDPHEDHNAYHDPAYVPVIRQLKQEPSSQCGYGSV